MSICRIAFSFSQVCADVGDIGLDLQQCCLLERILNAMADLFQTSNLVLKITPFENLWSFSCKLLMALEHWLMQRPT